MNTMAAASSLRDLLDTSVDLTRRAGEITLGWFGSNELQVDSKDDGTPVTQADRAAEAFLRAELERRFPTDAILGEEEGDTSGTSGRQWIIDPIDGTKAFARGVPLYSNLLALLDDGEPIIGVINLPALGETVYAARGLGAHDSRGPVRVSDRSQVTGAYLTTSGFDYWDEDQLLRVKRAGLTMRTWGDGYGYALVATGRVEAMVDPIVAIWDLAPMPVIMTEAGGAFSATDGREGFDHGSGIATNGLLHGELVELLTGS